MDKIPVPETETIVIKKFGITVYSKTTTKIVEFDAKNFYDEMSKKISEDLKEQLKQSMGLK